MSAAPKSKDERAAAAGEEGRKSLGQAGAPMAAIREEVRGAAARGGRAGRGRASDADPHSGRLETRRQGPYC